MNPLRRLISRLRRPRCPAPPSPELREAERIRDLTEDRLWTVRDKTSEIIAVANRLERLGEQNDFAARLRSALGGQPGG